jgi:hypothetical protein
MIPFGLNTCPGCRSTGVRAPTYTWTAMAEALSRTASSTATNSKCSAPRSTAAQRAWTLGWNACAQRSARDHQRVGMRHEWNDRNIKALETCRWS